MMTDITAGDRKEMELVSSDEESNKRYRPSETEILDILRQCDYRDLKLSSEWRISFSFQIAVDLTQLYLQVKRTSIRITMKSLVSLRPSYRVV
jgi:hypothetical protein